MKEKEETEFTPGGSVLINPGSERGTWDLPDAETLEMKMNTKGAPKKRYRIKKIDVHEVILVLDGKEIKAERK